MPTVALNGDADQRLEFSDLVYKAEYQGAAADSIGATSHTPA